ncbi:biotin transport system substrate-specific component [Paenibacillus cellulosilyticus]|uniref:Biotin transporter n=1 Tax=Paenibacillus cellulosilyticus TaxID=375489 RepID=A0A2V2YXY9_9BACL|nr:biotin transporter BioY [Paenibacillus cellulosilyticus]PWW06484.1 biotin transport system substrate-specific component [Paenibacillus cellulosilyticus]QKS46175.1 biotin transporter BioY [Paenibacillus cellulosilyticus]
MKASSLRSIVFTALFGALFIALSAVKFELGFSAVPITLQNLAVMLAGAFLGARLGFSSIMIVLLLTATGLPLLHGQGGLSYMTGPTGGFIAAFPFNAFFVGLFVVKLMNSRLASNRTAMIVGLFLVFEVFGSLLSYVSGVPWLMHSVNYSFHQAMIKGCYPYLAGDALKAVVATGLTMSLYPFIAARHAKQSTAYTSATHKTGMSH